LEYLKNGEEGNIFIPCLFFMNSLVNNASEATIASQEFQVSSVTRQIAINVSALVLSGNLWSLNFSDKKSDILADRDNLSIFFNHCRDIKWLNMIRHWYIQNNIVNFDITEVNKDSYNHLVGLLLSYWYVNSYGSSESREFNIMSVSEEFIDGNFEGLENLLNAKKEEIVGSEKDIIIEIAREVSDLLSIISAIISNASKNTKNARRIEVFIVFLRESIWSFLRSIHVWKWNTISVENNIIYELLLIELNFWHIIDYADCVNKKNVDNAFDIAFKQLNKSLDHLVKLFEWKENDGRYYATLQLVDIQKSKMVLAKYERYSELQFEVCERHETNNLLENKGEIWKIQEMCLSDEQKEERGLSIELLLDFYSNKAGVTCDSSEDAITHFIWNIDSKHDNFHILIRQIYYILRYTDIDVLKLKEMSDSLTDLAFNISYSDFRHEIKRIYDATFYRLSYNQRRSTVEEVWKRISQENEKIDPLTGIWNRKAFVPDWEKLISRVNRGQVVEQAIVCMLDLDHFKFINDEYGHQKWDDVLKAVVEILQENFRSTDSIYRIWWEEFVVLAECKKKSLPMWIDKITKAIQDELYKHDNVQLKNEITISIGVSLLEEWMTMKEAMSQADQAMYYKKENWRNGVHVYDKNMLNAYAASKEMKQAVNR